MRLTVQQWLVLLWKCCLLRKRHYVTTTFELMLPLVIPGLLAYLASDVPQHNVESTQSVSKGSTIYKNPDMTFARSLAGINKSSRISKYMSVDGSYLYSPNTSFTESIVTEMESIWKSHGKPSVKFIGYPDEKSMAVAWAALSANDSQFTEMKGCLVFSENATLSDKAFGYKLRFPLYIQTEYLFPFKRYAGPVNRPSDYLRLLAPIQILVNEAYLNLMAKAEKLTREPTGNVRVYRFPYPEYIKPPQTSINVIDFIPMALIYSFIVTFPIIVKRIADEKVNRAREMFRMMGLSDWVYWGSTFVNYFLVHAIQSVIITVVFMIKFNGYSAVINFANPCFVLWILLTYGAAFIFFAMAASIPFSRPTPGVIAASILWVVSYAVPGHFLNFMFNEGIDIKSTESARIISCLIPNMGVMFAFHIISQEEVYGYGPSFSNLFDKIGLFGSLSLGVTIGMMTLSSLVSIVFIWYMDAVWPFQYGLPKPFYFPCLPSYWFGPPRTPLGAIGVQKLSTEGSKFFERKADSAVNSIRITELRKQFGRGSSRKYVVDNMSLEIFHGQITVLLGHNGAGKTTTMSMITGIFPPSDGTITVDGHNIQTETSKARRSISLCPQHNILYDELTSEEHLKLYAGIKGYPFSKTNLEVRDILEQVQLLDSAKKRSGKLSGGMKRKLCLAIALVGGTKIVILDEPTSGLDPEARRAIWDLLLSIRRERTILLTTHFMEEADALADRIAIMASGEVKCCGSPMFLKKVFGTGYQLRVSKSDDYRKDLLELLVKTHFPKGSLKSEIETEVIFSLESENQLTDTSKLPHFFDALEKSKAEMGIISCGLSVTTMEDVFLRVGNMTDKDFEDTTHETTLSECSTLILLDTESSLVNQLDNNNLRMTSKAKPLPTLQGFQLTMSRFKGLFIKRVHFSRRYWPMMLFQLVIPSAVFILLWYLDNKIRRDDDAEKPLEFNLKSMYGETEGFFRPDADEGTKGFGTQYYNPAARESGVNVTNLDPKGDPNNFLLPIADALGVDKFRRNYLVGATLQKPSNGSRVYDVWYNNEALHSLPSAISILYGAIQRELLGNDSRLSTSFEYIEDFQYFRQVYRAMSLQLMWLVLVGITMPFIGASYILFPIHERASKAKLTQLMSGLSPGLYWLANFTFDLLTHLFCCGMIFTIFALMDCHHIFIGNCNSIFGLFIILFTFGVASIPICYALSMFSQKPASGFAFLVILYLIAGVVLTVSMFIIDSFEESVSRKVYYTFLWTSRLFPIFSMSWGISKLYKSNTFAAACVKIPTSVLESRCKNIERHDPVFGCCKPLCEEEQRCYEFNNPLEWSDDGILQELVMMFVASIVFTLLLVLIEMNVQRFLYQIKKKLRQLTDGVTSESNSRAPSAQNIDSDVANEKKRITERLSKGNVTTVSDALVIEEMTKKFRSYVAVNNLSFGVHQQECFGLLGINGAGKTTTFRMLTGDLFPTKGNATIDSFDLKHDLKAFQQQLGYCPQFDALLDKLTGREMLDLFGRLRGIQKVHLKKKVKQLIGMVDLDQHADKLTETYSGGNKRKLSLALALVGTPQILLLDEPTSGVDPGARRKIWTTLAYIRQRYGCSIILTSHSMEECEALCSRIAIMVNGQFKCIGSIQHLRSKFGQGFTLVVKLKREMMETPKYVANVRKFIEQAIPSASLKDVHETVVHYHVCDTSLSWSPLFQVLERAKNQFNLEDYLLSDTTLEQIFISFARQQQAETKSDKIVV